MQIKVIMSGSFTCFQGIIVFFCCLFFKTKAREHANGWCGGSGICVASLGKKLGNNHKES